MTVVSNGTDVFEVSVVDVEAAKADGFRDLVPAGTRRARKLAARTKNTDGAHERSALLADPSGRTRNEQLARSRFEGLPLPPAVSDVAIKGGQRPLSVAAVNLQTGESTDLVSDVAIHAGDEVDVALSAQTLVRVEEVVDEEEERKTEIREQLATATGVEKLKLLVRLYGPSQMQLQSLWRSYGTSVVLHAVVLLLLSFVLLTVDDPLSGAAIISSVVAADETSDEMTEEVEMEVDVQELETDATEVSDLAGELSDTMGLTASDLTSSFDGSSLGGGAEGLSKELGKPKAAKAGFFGAKEVASRFVFVIDNSNSMTDGRFETALNELAKTITQLSPKQSYYVIFYSDTAYGLFFPRTVRNLIPATADNKKLTLYWLQTVQLCLKTNGAEAIQAAYQLNPDVIFVLGDGAFGDLNAIKAVMANRTAAQKKITLHALGMEVGQRAAQNFRFLSDSANGTYNDVGVHPQAATMARQNPRVKNNKRGPVWGIALPR